MFGLDGNVRQTIAPLDRPNNVDVEYGVMLGGVKTDIAVLDRAQAASPAHLRHSGRWRRARRSGAGRAAGARRSDRRSVRADGRVAVQAASATASRSRSSRRRPAGRRDYLWQYRLDGDGGDRANGRGVNATLVRRFGNFSRRGAAAGEIGEIEAVVVDDELGYVYYSDERFGIRKWHADPDHADAARELAVFGTDGYVGDREGLAIYAPDARDRRSAARLLVSSDQVEGATRVFLYPREGANGNPHHHPVIAVRETRSDETDGLDVTARALPGYPRGLLVMMNSAAPQFPRSTAGRTSLPRRSSRHAETEPSFSRRTEPTTSTSH